jgi:hypothetical protein
MAVAMAGGPGFWGRVLSGLVANPLTESWGRTMDRAVIAPMERAVVSDADLVMALPGMVARLAEGAEVPSQLQLALLERIKGGAVDPAAVKRLVNEPQSEEVAAAAAAGRTPQAEVAHSIAADAIREHRMSGALVDAAGVLRSLPANERAVLLDVAAQAPSDGANGLTMAGDVLRRYGLGSPLAAYGAVAGGGALGAVGIGELMEMLNKGDGDKGDGKKVEKEKSAARGETDGAM